MTEVKVHKFKKQPVTIALSDVPSGTFFHGSIRGFDGLWFRRGNHIVRVQKEGNTAEAELGRIEGTLVSLLCPLQQGHHDV